MLTAGLEHGGSGIGIGFPGFPVSNELDCQHQPAPPDVTDDLVSLLKVPKSREHGFSDLARVLLQAIFPEHLENRAAGRAACRVGPVGVEQELVTHGFCHMFLRDDGPDRKAVPHPLGHDNDLGDDPVGLESPHVVTGPAKAGLDLVSDQNASLCPYPFGRA